VCQYQWTPENQKWIADGNLVIQIFTILQVHNTLLGGGGGGGWKVVPPPSRLGCYREGTTLEPADFKTGYICRAMSGLVSIMTELSWFNSLLYEKFYTYIKIKNSYTVH
jgi:hypothetical protein